MKGFCVSFKTEEAAKESVERTYNKYHWTKDIRMLKF